MRPLSLVSVLLCLGLSLLPGEDDPVPGERSRSAPQAATRASAPPSRPAFAQPAQAPREGVSPGAPAGARAPDHAPLRAATAAAQEVAAARRLPAPGPGGGAAGVREMAYASKAHAEAIASTLQSPEVQDTVSPLARLYFAYFDRAPDYEGLGYYIDERDAGAALDAIADEFAASREFRMRYGEVDDAAFVDRAYRNVFGADPGAQQRAAWIAQLESGELTRGRLMLQFSESAAFRTATADEVFVTLAYAEALNRAPDPADLARWVRLLEAGHPRGALVAALLAGRGAR